MKVRNTSKKHRFHNCEPAEQVELNKLEEYLQGNRHVTSNKLLWFECNLGIEWANTVDVWHILRRKYQWLGFDDEILDDDIIAIDHRSNVQFQKAHDAGRINNHVVLVKRIGRYAKDMRVLGTLNGIRIEFWRHETDHRGAGQTLLYFNGHRIRANLLIKGWPNRVRLDSVLDSNVASILLAHPMKIVQKLASHFVN